jgi:hypothetical protein
VLDGLYALQLGSTVDNRDTYSSARQWVQVPWTHPQVTVSFWAYTWAESLGGADRQQFVLLGPGDAVWAVPWKVLQDEQAWRWHSFDLIGVAGETVALYFNVINDGAGGRTALFVDEVHAWACTAGAALPASAVGPAAPEPLAAGTAVSGEMINPATTPPPDWAMGTPIPREMAGPAATPPPDWTTVAVGGAGQAREPSASATPRPTATIAPAASAPTPQAAGILQRLTARWPRGWPFVVLAIVALLIFILLLARPKQSV